MYMAAPAMASTIIHSRIISIRTLSAALRAWFESASKRRIALASTWFALMTRIAAKASWIREVRLLLASRAKRARRCKRGV